MCVAVSLVGLEEHTMVLSSEPRFCCIQRVHLVVSAKMLF